MISDSERLVRRVHSRPVVGDLLVVHERLEIRWPNYPRHTYEHRILVTGVFDGPTWTLVQALVFDQSVVRGRVSWRLLGLRSYRAEDALDRVQFKSSLLIPWGQLVRRAKIVHDRESPQAVAMAARSVRDLAQVRAHDKLRGHVRALMEKYARERENRGKE